MSTNTNVSRTLGPAHHTDGPFMVQRPQTPAAITDGLSNTIFMSESLLGTDASSLTKENADPRYHYLNEVGRMITESTHQDFPLDQSRWPRGYCWNGGYFRSTLYNHYLSPNTKEFDVHTNDLLNYLQSCGIFAARSHHRGGVNAVKGDGSVHFYSDTVDIDVWRALATRGGGEVTSL